MKRPLSPMCLLENGRICLPFSPCLDLKDPANGHADLQVQREKKRLLFSLCEVCNIQLNSAAQAQVHYNGKSHLKRVKQLNNGELPNASESSATLGGGTSAELSGQSGGFGLAVAAFALSPAGVLWHELRHIPVSAVSRTPMAAGQALHSSRALFVTAQDITQAR
ncbi:hypothetical protein SKAU_G00236590 [Synaphobranchus kaupii]|uniref:U1-type domain-containing protein n=1 Tax=Synaphobranchus kaupii TaxID=118154 RepID=A0A9Q1F6T6_SYNKA|nr:hypothetical protein SKAU_G00236590 [Synaphobranchus kaupii]